MFAKHYFGSHYFSSRYFVEAGLVANPAVEPILGGIHHDGPIQYRRILRIEPVVGTGVLRVRAIQCSATGVYSDKFIREQELLFLLMAAI